MLSWQHLDKAPKKIRWETCRYLVEEHLGQGRCKFKGPVVKNMQDVFEKQQGGSLWLEWVREHRMAGEVTGIRGIGQKSDHVGSLKKVLGALYLYLLSTPHWMHTDPMASYGPGSSPSEGLCWPQVHSRPLCREQARELMILGVAPNLCGVGE